MVFGSDIAIVVRARHGRNLIVQWCVDKLVCQGCFGVALCRLRLAAACC
jgi:hypothetical protein